MEERQARKWRLLFFFIPQREHFLLRLNWFTVCYLWQVPTYYPEDVNWATFTKCCFCLFQRIGVTRSERLQQSSADQSTCAEGNRPQVRFTAAYFPSESHIAPGVTDTRASTETSPFSTYVPHTGISLCPIFYWLATFIEQRLWNGYVQLISYRH